MKYHIRTFGCQQNIADSERIARYYESRGYTEAADLDSTDIFVINSCMVRGQAEDRVYGLVRKVKKLKKINPQFKIIVTGCIVGAAAREPSGQLKRKLEKNYPEVDEFLPIEEVGFEYQPVRKDREHAWVPITHGCNNYCTFCIVPYSRGKEISRPYEGIIAEIESLKHHGFTKVTLLGQNVNSYGADLVKKQMRESKGEMYEIPGGRQVKPVMVKHLGRMRIPTLFPHLLEDVCKMGFDMVNFTSSNPWDYSDELINVLKENKNINEWLHLPVQAGDNALLKRMNRWYTREQYLELIAKIRNARPDLHISTDIIVGFPGETEEEFQNTVDLCKKVNFIKAYIARYSPRPGTKAEQELQDDVPHEVKLERFHILDKLIHNK